MRIEQQLVFLPGANGQGDFWNPIRALLPDHDGFAVDWPGVNGNPPVAGVDSYEAMADHTIALIEASPAPAGRVVIAQSMGGVIADIVTLRRPDLVDGLVLVATSGGIDTRALGGRQWEPEDPAERLWIHERRDDLSARLAEIEVPVQLIWAKDDPISPAQVGERLLELFTDAQLHVFDSDDHWVAIERAPEVAELIVSFVRDRVAPTGGSASGNGQP